MTEIILPKTDIVVPKGAVQLILADKFGRIKDIQYVKNLITTVGKNSIADGLRGTIDNNKGIITYCAVGTDSTAPVPGNTILGAELFRKLISVRSVSGNIATFQTYFTTEEANGSLREAGLFGDAASGTIESGTLFAHVAINRTKTSNDTLTLNWSITIG